jgi:hypothetical protein
MECISYEQNLSLNLIQNLKLRALGGRRQAQVGKLPITRWAKIESIYGGKWERYFPKPVKISVLSFMEKDFEGNSAVPLDLY